MALNRYAVELLGTFFLMLTIGMVVIPPGEAGALAPVAIGVVLIALVYAGGHVSGAHYNPAVTLAVLIRKGIRGAEAAGYVVAQLAGAAIAVFAAAWLKGDADPSTIEVAAGRNFLAELLFTFALVWVILNVATAKKNEGNQFFGVAIGLTVMAGAFAVGPISGAAFNPAVTTGLGIVGILEWPVAAVQYAAQAVAGVLAAVVFGATVRE